MYNVVVDRDKKRVILEFDNLDEARVEDIIKLKNEHKIPQGYSIKVIRSTDSIHKKQ